MGEIRRRGERKVGRERKVGSSELGGEGRGLETVMEGICGFLSPHFFDKWR